MFQLVGIAFEVHDSHKLKKNREKGIPDPTDRQGQKKYMPVIEDPSVLDIVHYSYCFVGLLTGKLILSIWFGKKLLPLPGLERGYV